MSGFLGVRASFLPVILTYIKIRDALEDNNGTLRGLYHLKPAGRNQGMKTKARNNSTNAMKISLSFIL